MIPATQPLIPPYLSTMSPAIIASELPAPPALERWFLEQPLPAIIALILLGTVALFIHHQRAQTRRGLAFFAGALAAAAAVFTLATFITTRREEVSARTNAFLASIEAADAKAVREMLDDPLVIASAGEQVDEFTRDTLLAVVANFRAFRVQDMSFRPRGAAIEGPTVARTQTTIRAAVMGDARPFYSTWEFTWRQAGDKAWKLTRLECLTMYGQTPNLSWARYARQAIAGPSGNGLNTARPTRSR